MIARHALCSFGSSMSVCEDIAHTGATYSVIEYHMATRATMGHRGLQIHGWKNDVRIFVDHSNSKNTSPMPTVATRTVIE